MALLTPGCCDTQPGQAGPTGCSSRAAISQPPLPGDAAASPPRPGRSMAEPSGPQLPAPLPRPLPAAFFGAVATGNPVVDSLEAELRDTLGFLRRLRGAGEAEPQRHELHRRGANTLFNIWIKYKPQLPDWYYNDKLLKVGDSLAQIKEYKLALLQCYGRYLQQFLSGNPDNIMDDANQFKSTFFPNGFRDKNAALTFHALQERNACIYQMVCSRDRNLQKQESLQTCFKVLSSLRLTMQVALPQQDLCWLIYNGTIHIYTICRHLMMIGQSAKVLEYLLWASICMELSIPLLSVHYLTWRATLYAAVSQCYFDCQAGIHGEVFARRGLIQIDELKQLENISSSQKNSETRKVFREATMKMSVMIFKRAVYESRRKPKSSFRPKLRVSLKETQNLPWPRTTTEQLLMEMFDGTAAQFLAILEALSDSSRRVLHPTPPVPDEPEIRDVISELFFAGLEILSGGVSSTDVQGDVCTCNFGIINASSTLLQLILSGEKSVSGEAAVKFVKLAFNYEEWDVFDSAIVFVTNFLQAQNEPRWKKAEMELKLLTLMRPLLFPRKFKHSFSVSETSTRGDNVPCVSNKKSKVRSSIKHGEPSHDLIILATTVFSCVSTSKQNILPDKEILFDVLIFLWQKCKAGLQRTQTNGSGYFKYNHKYKASKWVYVLWIINEVILKSNVADTDVVMVTEITLCLTAILENTADSASKSKKKSGKRSVILSEDETCDIPEILTRSPTEQLQLAYESLEKTINEMNKSRLMTILPDGKSIFDNCCTKVDSNDQNLSSILEWSNDKTGTGNSFLMDLHLELIQAQHRIAVKLLKLTQGVQKDGRSLKSSKYRVKNIEDSHYLTEEDIIRKIKKNKLSRAIFLMEKAAQMFPNDLSTSSQRQLLKEALTLIEQVEAEQSALYHSLKEFMSSKKKSRVPPPPLLLSRSHCSMTFKPASFSSDVQVSWYSILGCVAGENNMKVRLNNNKLPNAGEEIPADGKSLLEVRGLDSNEKYIFAVAAYSSDGKLIGDAIGETTRPILAYPPLSATTVRAYLTQVAYQTGNYTLARGAFSPMWDYFVTNSSSLPTNAAVISARSSLTISEKRLRFEAISQTSPTTLYLFLRNIFAICDINIMEGALFCDSVCSNEMLYKKQVDRLAECERMTVALELSNFLNDASYALQSVVQCYGLLAPIIYYKISAVPVVQILIKCLAVLQEIPCAALQTRQAGCYESIQHMVACTSFYTAKVLRSWKEYELAVVIINYGKKLLDSSQTTSSGQSGATETEETHKIKNISAKKSHLAAMEKATENLSALESNLLKLTKPARGSELGGQEDPLFLYPIISCWTSNTAYREVMKFRKKSRFLEFFIQVLHKILNEEKFHSVLEWVENVRTHLKKRNNHILCISETPRQKTSSPSVTEGTKKYATGAVEFQKSMEKSPLKKQAASASKKQRKVTSSSTRKMQTLRQYCMKHTNIMKSPEAQRKHQEELRKVARNTLVILLKPIVSNYLKRKKFHQICLEEMPWRSQMNIYVAIAHYNLFKKKLEEQYNIGIGGSRCQDSYNILDSEIFSLKNSGTVVVREVVENKQRTLMALPLENSPSELTKRQTHTNRSSEHSTKLCGRDTPQTQVTNDMEVSISLSPKERKQFPSNSTLLDHFTKIFLHLRRAAVLAHRGGHWTLLQNSCRELWNYTQESQSIANHSHSYKGAFPITRAFLRKTVWLPFYLASDMIIDMITELQASNSLKIMEPEGDFCIPSCFGGITDENGGSNLHPQSPLDDVNVVDLKWICNLILKTLEFLYQMKKWGALVHIAVQFNVLTHERYTEQVSPLLVYAQRQLLERLQQFSGPDSHKSPFIQYLSNNANKMSCRDYIGQNLQLPVAPSASVLVFPGCFLYPEMKNDYADGSQAKPVVYVPLDVEDTLKCFRETLKKSKYHSRALRHSRKLLSLFLAHIQENVGRTISHVSPNRRLGFNVGAELAFLPTPCDLSKENFNFSTSIESKPMPQSQLSVIVSSYEQTIGILEVNNQRDLRVQALHELGNLHFYAGKKRAAFKYWCQALDETLNIADILNNWQELGFSKNATECFAVRRSTDISQKFLSQAGIWGCLHAAVLVAKIAQYITTSNVRLRTKYCYFSAILFKTLFRASLPHPTSDCDFAQYETHTLIPGIDLFSDHYRADISTVVASLNFLMFELHCAKQNLTIKVLTDIGFFTEAFHELCLLNFGERIPWKIPAGYKKNEEMKTLLNFDSSKSLLSFTNLQVLEDIFNWSLSLTMVPLCNQQILNKLILAKMHFIICLSATINNIPEKVEKCIYSDDNKPDEITPSNIKVKVDAVKNSRQQEQRGTAMKLIACKDELNMTMLKGILLSEAEENLNHLVQNIEDKYDGMICRCSAEDLEVLIEAKLQLAAISQQWHQAAFSVALTFSAIRLLQDADIFRMKATHFQEKKDKRESLDSYVGDVQLPHSTIAQDHLNIPLWLRCRKMLVTALVTQIHSVGDKEENYVTERRNIIKEVISEAEAFGDIETQAEMMVQAAILDLQEGCPMADIKLLLQDIISLLQEDKFISPPASLTLVKSMLLMTDLLALQTVENKEYCSSAVDPLNLLNLAHEITLKEIFFCGEYIEQQIEDSTLTCLVLPAKNIYLPYINLLAQVKMRIGHTLAERVACTPEREDPMQWLRALTHLETALKLCRASATKVLDMEAQILFQIGKVECQITKAGNNKSYRAVETLLEAVKLSHQHDQNFELIRRSYLEIALLNLHFAKNNENLSQRDKMVPSKSEISAGELSSSPGEALKSESYKVRAWIAVRAARQVSEAVVASQLLIGMESIKEHDVKDAVQQKIPEFASMDLLASYRDYLSDGYNVVCGSHTASSTENKQIVQKEQNQNEGMECLDTSASEKKEIITWVHLIRYHSYIKGLCHTNLFAAHKSGLGSFSGRDGHFNSLFGSWIVLRIAEMHSFLKKHLFEYSVCCLENFPEQLQNLQVSHGSPPDSSKMSLENFGISPKVSCVKIASLVSVITEADSQMESKAASASNKEISIQWYIPSLEKPTNDTETKILLLYAYNTKPVKISNVKFFSSMSVFSGQLWIPLARIISLREKLSNLKHHVEMLMQSSGNSSAAEPTSFLEQNETLKITPSETAEMNIAKVHLDEKTEEMVIRCLSEVKALLSAVPVLTLPLTEIPFDITLQSIATLEDMFDLANGCTVTEESLFSWIISLFH
ncbi:cilia- and flagella-associated protein 54 isoform X2 [Numida meleagris]|uniref:cilia- and flagella-associated protein 54 isoform X2 n=1 Tax=Numida meleagris TaxID=8996 RepID=UPI000B3DCCCA|nr:cilia- and flagella-associated protein 54 isoform X2 [Numida meleagris]